MPTRGQIINEFVVFDGYLFARVAQLKKQAYFISAVYKLIIGYDKTEASRYF
jgi:hypothetical protein